MTINRGNSFIYVCYPRTGTHFIREWLHKCFNAEEVGANSREYPFSGDTHLPITRIDKKERNRHFKWGMVRNPFDFYVSWWAGFRNNQEYSGFFKEFKSFLKQLMESDYCYHDYIDFGLMKRLDIGLATFWYIRLFCDYEKLFALDSLDGVDLKEECLIDEVITYENFKDEINLMFRNRLLPLTEEQIILLESNERLANSEHEKWCEYYDNESTKLVLHKDRLIFKMFPQYV